jgi:two-component system phosphate regulon response regulator PhoB
MILIVDDQLDIARALAMLLEDSGYHAEVAESGRQALDKLGQMTPQAVILDMMMPDIDGSAVLRAMRSNPDMQHVPVVVFSADSNQQRIEQTIRLGAQDYIIKGASGWEDLRSRIERVLAEPLHGPPAETSRH